MPISEALRQSVLLRVRGLERGERAVLMRASVIGRRFPVAVLLATTRWPPGRVRAALGRACSLDILVAEPSNEVYAFSHALTRDIIYGELMNARVRPIHRLVARVLEQLADPSAPPVDELAYHYWVAGDRRRARKYNELAGDRACAAFAADEARTYYVRARAFVPLDSRGYVRLTEKLRSIETSLAGPA